MSKLRSPESAVAWVIFFPLGVAVNAILLWGMRDIVEFPLTPIQMAFNATWLIAGCAFYRRARRTM